MSQPQLGFVGDSDGDSVRDDVDAFPNDSTGQKTLMEMVGNNADLMMIKMA